MVSVAEKAPLMVSSVNREVSEPPLNCRKRSDDIETRVQLLPWDEPGGCLLTGLAVSGTKVARARFRLQRGTWERLAPMVSAGCWTGRREGGVQAAETVRGGVPMRGRRADRPVVAVMPGNAGGAKGMGCPGSFVDQPAWPGGVG